MTMRKRFCSIVLALVLAFVSVSYFGGVAEAEAATDRVYLEREIFGELTNLNTGAPSFRLFLKG